MSELIGNAKVRFPLNKSKESKSTTESTNQNNLDSAGKPLANKTVEVALKEFDAEEEIIINEYAENLFNIAESYYFQGLDSKAYEYYLAFVGSGSYHPVYLFNSLKNIGNIKIRMGDIEGAEEFYHKAFTLNPNSDVLLVNLGTLEIQKREYEKALQRYRQAVEINPHNCRGWIGLAIAHREYGDLELAWGNLEKALDINSTEETALELAIQWGIKEGKIDCLVKRIQNYLEVNSTDMHMRAQLARVLIIGGRLSPAKNYLQDSLNLDPQNHELVEISQAIASSVGGV